MDSNQPELQEPPAGSVNLADFLTDLRSELARAQQQQAAGSSLKLGVEEVSIELEVAVTTSRESGGSGKASAEFWVLNAEVAGTGGVSSQRFPTQRLTFTLKPRDEQVAYGPRGEVQQVTVRGVDVAGEVGVREEAPVLRPTSTVEDAMDRDLGA